MLKEYAERMTSVLVDIIEKVVPKLAAEVFQRKGGPVLSDFEETHFNPGQLSELGGCKIAEGRKGISQDTAHNGRVVVDEDVLTASAALELCHKIHLLTGFLNSVVDVGKPFEVVTEGNSKDLCRGDAFNHNTSGCVSHLAEVDSCTGGGDVETFGLGGV